MERLNPFLEAELDPEAAQKHASRNKEFWSLVFSGTGISYTEWKAMDLAEYSEAREAYLNYIEDVKEARANGS